MAVAHADFILELQTNLAHDEMPPVWMWPFQERVNKWIDGVIARRKDSSSKPDDPEDDTMQDNVLLDELKRRRGG